METLLAEHETRRTHRRQKREGEEMVSFSFRIASSPSYNCIISSSPFLKPIAWRLSASCKQQRLLPALGAAKERRLNIHSSNGSRSSTPFCTTTKAASPLTAETAATDGEGREEGGEEESWQAFCAQVGGEWDGYGAEFTTRVEPLELPNAVVPETFREWGVQIHDWQTQRPALPQPAQKGKLWYKVIRLLPTVGCEADAATTFSVEECSTQEGGAAAAASALAYHKNGSYTAVWRGQPTILENPGPGPGKLVVREGEGLAVEQCLVVQDNNGRTRVRVLHQLLPRRNSITVYRESWEGPFRNGESLGGCASSTSAFATQARLEASSLAGNWHVDQFATQTVTEAPAAEAKSCQITELTPVSSKEWERELLDDTIFLPKDLWTYVNMAQNGGTVIETGWLVNLDQSIVSGCQLESSGEIKEVYVRFEQRISKM